MYYNSMVYYGWTFVMVDEDLDNGFGILITWSCRPRANCHGYWYDSLTIVRDHPLRFCFLRLYHLHYFYC
jgi:hypothetical protein